MCVTPNHISGVGSVACHQCWQCKANRVNDYVGRCIAESKVSDQTLAVTLTYAEDSPHSATLIYADIQKFLKRLRKRASDLQKKGLPSYSVRYIVAGEYGSKKGRAHWHAILFFKGKGFEPPPMEMRVDWEFWPHGYSYFQKPDYGGFSYVLKYLLKDTQDINAQGHFALSKKPPLGESFFLIGKCRPTRFERFVPTNLAIQIFRRARQQREDAPLLPPRGDAGKVSRKVSRWIRGPRPSRPAYVPPSAISTQRNH